MYDTTFVVQGAIGLTTANNLASIRYFYPNSKIILSTWPNQSIKDLQFDDLIVNIDPGPVKTFENHGLNTNRQIVSTYSGLKRVQTQKVIKSRTDIGISKRCPDLFSDLAGQYFKKK